MRPKERRPSGQSDIFQSRLDQIIDLNHPLVKLSQKIDWAFLETKFGSVYTDKKGRPPLPTRLMAWLEILKHRTICRTRFCAPGGLRTLIISTFAAKSFSATVCHLTARQ